MGNKILGAYYFRGGFFTFVPDHVRADLDGMAALGTDVVCLAVNVNDPSYNMTNIDFMIEQSHARGMKVFVVPSRIAGITAGAPLTPCLFGYLHPDSWSLRRDGTPHMRRVGPVCSFYHPETLNWFLTEVGAILDRFAFDGLIWDEPKSTYWQDFSPRALANNPDADFRIYMQHFAAFFSQVNVGLREGRESLTVAHFDEASRNDTVVEESAKIKGLDYFGTDGRPWLCQDHDHEGTTKVIPGYGERYFAAARANGVAPMALIENQRIESQARLDAMEQTLPAILAMDIEFLLYYYYGHNQADPERNMQIMRTHLPTWKATDIPTS